MKYLNTKSILTIALLVTVSLAMNPVFAHGENAVDGEEDHAASLGEPGDSNKVSRTIHITMNDTMRFSPALIRVKRGETIGFALKNNGKIKHEMVLGNTDELKEHAALMQKFPEMIHSDPNQASVEPGQAGEIVWHFTKAGTFNFACLQPSHFEAGMVGKILTK